MTYLTVPINTNELTMSSIELLEIINAARLDQGETAIRRNDFSARVADELDGDYYESFVVENSNGTKTTVYRISRDQCTLVSMRESKAVRRSVLEKLKATDKKAELPANYIQALEALVESEKQKQLAIATKAQISSSREASVMGKLSAASRKMKRLEKELGRNSVEATVTAVEKATNHKYGKQGFRPLKGWCKENGIKPSKVPCPRYGEVVAWPAGAWFECYGLDLEGIFGEIAA